MKQTVLFYGLIAGLIVAAMLIITTTMCYHDENFQSSMTLGFGTMFIAFGTIFIAVKKVRDKYNGGVITFGKAFLTGLYVALIASTIYVAVWLVDYYVFIPDFMDKYTAHVLKEVKADGGTAQEMQAKIDEMKSYKELYKNPLYVVLLTYMEILPLGIVVSLLSAFIFKRTSRRGLAGA